MSLVLRLSASPAETGTTRDLEVRVLESDGDLLGEMSGQVTVEGSSTPWADTQLQLIFNLLNAPLPKTGRYAFHVFVGGDDKASVPLEVIASSIEEGESDDH